MYMSLRYLFNYASLTNKYKLCVVRKAKPFTGMKPGTLEYNSATLVNKPRRSLYKNSSVEVWEFGKQ